MKDQAPKSHSDHAARIDGAAIQRSARPPKFAPQASPMQLSKYQQEDDGPGTWERVNEAMSPAAAAYQARITGRGAEWSYLVNGVKFDGWRKPVLLEAKSGMANMVDKNGEFHPWFKGRQDMEGQMRRQAFAAPDHRIRWCFQEASVAEAASNLNVPGNVDIVHQA